MIRNQLPSKQQCTTKLLHNKIITPLDHLTTVPLNAKILIVSDDIDCVICMNSMKEQMVAELKCKHRYHTQCIRKWQQQSCKCPLCNNNQSK